jgi:hypothetical protein
MRWYPTRVGLLWPGRALAGVVLALVAATMAGVVAAPLAQAGLAGQVAPPGAVVLVERLGMDEALDAVGPGAGVAGFVSTLPVHQPLASRVLSLAAGRRVDALAAVEDNPGAGLPDPATVDRIRADNPGVRLGRLPPTRVLAYPGLEAAGLFTLGPSGQAIPAGRLDPGGQPIPLQPGQLLVLAVPDAPALADLVGRLQAADGAGPVMVLGLRAAPGRANSAPLLVLRHPDARGLVTSDSTRRLGLVALEDVRPTLAGGPSAGDDGTGIRIVDNSDPAVAATRLDRRVAALVAARTWAIPLLCLAAVLALFALLATWRVQRSGEPMVEGPRWAGTGALSPAAAARWLLALTLALPPGYLVASMAEPLAARMWRTLLPGSLGDPGEVVPLAVAWVGSGIAVAIALTFLALRLDRPTPDRAPGPGPALASDPLHAPAPAAPDSAPTPESGSAGTPESDPAHDPERDPQPAPVPPAPVEPAPVEPAPGPRLDPRWGSVADGQATFRGSSTAPASAHEAHFGTPLSASLPDPSRGASPARIPPSQGGRSPTRVPAPVLLGAVLLGLVALDLVLGGDGLAQPLLGGSAWDGERFYGLGNGYFAFALAAALLVIGFAPLPMMPAAALLVGLGVVDGLPRLGADVGGALTSMLTAGAALVVLAPGRPKLRRVVLLGGLAVVAAVAVALGVGLGGPVTHAGRFAERLQQGPADAAGVVVDQLARNLRLLANSPFAWVGPLQVAAAGLIALRPPPPFQGLSGWIRRVLGLGAFGSLLLILLNDTGVTATAASGLFLLAIPAWAWLARHHPSSPPPSRPPARPAVGVRPPGY